MIFPRRIGLLEHTNNCLLQRFVCNKQTRPKAEKGVRVNPLRKDPVNLRSADLLKECGQDHCF